MSDEFLNIRGHFVHAKWYLKFCSEKKILIGFTRVFPRLARVAWKWLVFHSFFRAYPKNGKNDHLTMIFLRLPLAVFLSEAGSWEVSRLNYQRPEFFCNILIHLLIRWRKRKRESGFCRRFAVNAIFNLSTDWVYTVFPLVAHLDTNWVLLAFFRASRLECDSVFRVFPRVVRLACLSVSSSEEYFRLIRLLLFTLILRQST